jgi:hypothetical protein
MKLVQPRHFFLFKCLYEATEMNKLDEKTIKFLFGATCAKQDTGFVGSHLV